MKGEKSNTEHDLPAELKTIQRFFSSRMILLTTLIIYIIKCTVVRYFSFKEVKAFSCIVSL